MGSVWLGAADGIASHFLSAPFARFEAWANAIEAEFPGEIGHGVVALIRDVSIRRAAALQGANAASAECVDRMLDWYYAEFCYHERYALERTLLAEADGSMLPERDFVAARDLLRRSACNREVVELWRLLLEGRPILRDPQTLPYRSEDGVFRLSYWTFAECVLLDREVKAIAPPAPNGDAEQAVAAALRATSVAVAANTGLIITVA